MLIVSTSTGLGVELSTEEKEQSTEELSVFTNYNNFKADGQGFTLSKMPLVEFSEGPAIETVILTWFGDIKFNDVDYVAREIIYVFRGTYNEFLSQGGKITAAGDPRMLVAAYVEQLEAFEIFTTATYDNIFTKFIDTGSPVMKRYGFEGYDAPGYDPVLVYSGTTEFISRDQAAAILNRSSAELTQTNFLLEWRDREQNRPKIGRNAINIGTAFQLSGKAQESESNSQSQSTIGFFIGISVCTNIVMALTTYLIWKFFYPIKKTNASEEVVLTVA